MALKVKLRWPGHVVRRDDCRMQDASGGTDDCRILDMSSGGTDDCRMLDMPSGGIAVHRADCKVKPMWPSRGRTRAAGRYR